MRRFLKSIAMAASLFLIAVQVLGWLQALHPAFDSLSHFRLHFAALLLVPAFIFAAARKWSWVAISVCSILVSVWQSAPYLPGWGPGYSERLLGRSATGVRVVQMNLRFNNQHTHLAIAALKTANADIMLLQEVTRTTEDVLTAFLKSHPHQVSCQKRGVGSVAILSRFPFASEDSQKCARFFGYASAKVRIAGQTVSLASFHSRWPWPASQSNQIERLRKDFESLNHPLILAGDFNAAPWSAAVQGVATMTRTSVVSGLKFTWAPRFVEFKTNIGALLPIDHLLVSSLVQPRSRKVLADGGSDHFPVLTEFFLWKQ